MSDRLLQGTPLQLAGCPLWWIRNSPQLQIGQYIGTLTRAKILLRFFRVLHHNCQIEAEIGNEMDGWDQPLAASGLERFALQSSVAGKSAVPGSGQCSQPGECLRANCGRNTCSKCLLLRHQRTQSLANRLCSWASDHPGLTGLPSLLPVPSERQRAP